MLGYAVTEGKRPRGAEYDALLASGCPAFTLSLNKDFFFTTSKMAIRGEEKKAGVFFFAPVKCFRRGSAASQQHLPQGHPSPATLMLLTIQIYFKTASGVRIEVAAIFTSLYVLSPGPKTGPG